MALGQGDLSTLGCEFVLQYGAIELDVDFKLVLCNFLDRFESRINWSNSYF